MLKADDSGIANDEYCFSRKEGTLYLQINLPEVLALIGGVSMSAPRTYREAVIWGWWVVLCVLPFNSSV
jgi:hypothetical protein